MLSTVAEIHRNLHNFDWIDMEDWFNPSKINKYFSKNIFLIYWFEFKFNYF